MRFRTGLLFFVTATPITGAWLPQRLFTSFSSGRVQGVASAEPTMTDACPDVSTVLGDNLELLSDQQRSLVEGLLSLGQEHIFADWPASGQEDDRKLRLVEQLAQLDASYPGGIAAYVTKARGLLEASARGDNPFDGFTPSVPLGEEVIFGDEEFVAMEEAGLRAAAKTTFVLVAGGLGERLGFSGIKLALPVDGCTGQSFLGMYAAWILAIQARARTLLEDPALELPLAIMTSGDTDKATRKLLAAQNNFGLSPTQVRVIMQDKVPALSDSSARLAMSKKDPFEVETKPHGHGDVHHLLLRSGIAREWADAGKEWMFFFQDTNPLVLHALIPMLGVSVDRSYDMNSLCVPRRAGEAAGAITTLTRDNGESLTINVEYNQLDPMLRSTSDFANGDVDDPNTGYSPFPGNVNNLLVFLPNYARVLEGPDQGVVEEFVNPKYKDETRTTFKKPTRLECMMQDLPKLMSKELGADAKVGFTTMQRWLTFSPAKNAPDAGAASAQKGSPPGTPSSAEADFYSAYRQALRISAGVDVAEGEEQEMLGVPVTLSPAVVLAPSFALTADDVRAKVSGGHITGRSALVVEGEGVTIAGLELDGALVIRACPGANVVVNGLRVQNDGWSFVPLSDEELAAAPEEIRIRGYRVDKKATMEIVVDQPGDYVVDPETGAVSPA